MRPAIFVVSLFVVAVAAYFVGQDSSPSGLSREDVKGIVEETLVEKPEIVMQAAQAYQVKQQQTQQDQGKVSAVQLQDEIFNPDSPAQGDANASVVFAEFFDYQCGHCQTMWTRMEQFKRNNPEVRVVFKELPIFGGNSVIAAQVALAADMQGKYYQMHNALMKLGKARTLNEETIFSAADEIGLDLAQLKTDMNTPAVRGELDRNRQLAQALGFKGTPAFVVRSPATNMKPELIYGAVPISRLEQYTK